MAHLMYNKKIGSWYIVNKINFIKAKKFKDVSISLRFASHGNVNLSARALLSIILSDRSENYASKVLMNDKLDNMFGAHLSSSVFAYGYANVIEVSLSALSPKYVEDDLLVEQVEFLSELIYKPLLNEDLFKEAKINLRDIIMRSKDSLNSYVVSESLRVAGKGYPLEFSRYGSLEDLEKITLDDIKVEYEKMINQDSLIITLVGDADEAEFGQLIKDNFKEHNSSDFKTNYLLSSNQVSKVTDKMSVPSPYFSIVFNTNVLNVGREYWALQLMSMVLGQLPNSYLFQEVREKRSLTYSIRSMVGGYDGVLIISSGVRDKSEDEAIEISLEQVKRIQASDVSSVLFKSAKAMLINSMHQTSDSNRRILDSEYRKVLLKEDLSTDDLIALVNSINLEEIVEVANKLVLNTIYKIEKSDEDA